MKDADEEQIQTASESKDMRKGKMLVEKKSFLKNTGLLLSAREKIVNNFKSKLFPTRNLEPEPAVFDVPKLTKKLKLTDIWKKIIRDEANINTVIFTEHFKYQNPSYC